MLPILSIAPPQFTMSLWARVLSAGVLDHEQETSLEDLFPTLQLPVRRFQAELGMGRSAWVIDLSVKGVGVMLMPTASSRPERSPDPSESGSSGPRKKQER